MRHRLPTATLLAAMAPVLLPAAFAANTPALAQAPQQTAQPTESQLLEDFIHYVRIRRDDLAAASGDAVLARGLDPRAFVAIVEDSPRAEDFDDAVRRAMVIPAVEPTAAALFKLYEQGRLDRSRNPEEIAQNIALLAGNARGRILARERLNAAGEYALPQLLQALQAKADPALETEIQRLLADMGGQAVAPLCAALLDVPPALQARLATILGQIGSDRAAPYLFELMRSAETQEVRGAAAGAIRRVGAEPIEGAPVAELYLALAERYLDEQESLTMFPREDHQLVWAYEPAVGLFAEAIRTPVFHEVEAMRLAEQAITAEPTNTSAMPLWLSAYFSAEIDAAEIDVPGGYTPPVWPDDRREAAFYAVAAGTDASQTVLDRAMADLDTPLVRRAVAALDRTAGAATAVAPSSNGEPSPLARAIAYPDRRVQYESAMAIARAMPSTFFEGAERVTPLLAGAVRDAGARYAGVVAVDAGERQRLAAALADEGFTVLAPGASLSDLRSSIADAPGVDLLVVRTDRPESAEQFLGAVRADAKLRVAPVLVLAEGAAHRAIAAAYRGARLVAPLRAGVSDSQLRAEIAALSLRAAGPELTEEEARAYALDALSTLRDLAIAGSGPLDPAEAARPLIDALGSAEPGTAFVLLDVLSRLDRPIAQIAVVDAALDTAGADRAAFLGFALHSVRAFGSSLRPGQVRAIQDIADTGDATEALSAAALLGAIRAAGDTADLILSN